MWDSCAVLTVSQAQSPIPSIAPPPKILITTKNIGKKKACARTHDLSAEGND